MKHGARHLQSIGKAQSFTSLLWHLELLGLPGQPSWGEIFPQLSKVDPGTCPTQEVLRFTSKCKMAQTIPVSQ